MFTVRDVLIFFAGAQFFHTLSHILLPFFFTLPVQMGSFIFTSTMNLWAIFLNGLITLILLWAASKARS